MLLENHQQLHHIFFEFYIYRGNILSKKDLQKQLCLKFHEIYTNQKYKKIKITSINIFITYCLSLIALRNKLYCRRMSIDSFFTHFVSHIAIKDKFYCMVVIIKSLITHLFIAHSS